MPRMLAEVELPPGIPPGAIYGKRGSNIKWLLQEVGPGVHIRVEERLVRIAASDNVILCRAVQLLERQIAANLALGKCYSIRRMHIRLGLATGVLKLKKRPAPHCDLDQPVNSAAISSVPGCTLLTALLRQPGRSLFLSYRYLRGPFKRTRSTPG